MIRLQEKGAFLVKGRTLIPDGTDAAAQLKQLTGQELSPAQAAQNTMAYGILQKHNVADDMEQLQLRFDAMASHDITYVGIVQTARASGMKEFPLPYVLTNCHNSLCAVGGTINEDDHMFAISAAKKYGGIYVPTHLAVIHQFMREMMAGCGKMILGSDSHTRYGALGTMAIGEGGGELAKQLLGRTYDVTRPGVVAVYLKNKPHPGVGPQDIALAIIGKVFKNGYVKNKVMEFVGEGIAALPVEFRNGIDVMTTETTCLSSIWETDSHVQAYLAAHGRAEAYAELHPGDVAYYDGVIEVDMAAVEPMIALPFHPSNTYTIRELLTNPKDILHTVEEEARLQYEGAGVTLQLTDKIRDGGIYVDQGIVAGCAGGTFHNLCAVADILKGGTPGNDRFSMSVYSSSQPTYIGLVKNGVAEQLMTAGVIMRSAFCGPCFGAGDVPANGGLSIRHTTRNFPNREGSKPGDGQLSAVALMDARSIAATAINGGKLTPATDLAVEYKEYPYTFNGEVYQNRLYQGYGKAMPEAALAFGPNITDWPTMPPMPAHLLLKVSAFITDPVTTTDELIPSGDASSYRSNPLRLAEFTLSRRDPAYVGKSKVVRAVQTALEAGTALEKASPEAAEALEKAAALAGITVDEADIGIGSAIYAVKPGDGSAREQAASCQRVLGGWANVAKEYATKRYRSNLINWGILPFLLKDTPEFGADEYLFVPNLREAVFSGAATILAYAPNSGKQVTLTLGDLTVDEREILLAGCLINYYKSGK